jgi:hypothetical protein
MNASGVAQGCEAAWALCLAEATNRPAFPGNHKLSAVCGNASTNCTHRHETFSTYTYIITYRLFSYQLEMYPY